MSKGKTTVVTVKMPEEVNKKLMHYQAKRQIEGVSLSKQACIIEIISQIKVK